MPTVFLSKDGASPDGPFCAFRTDSSIRYDAFCDDFGPLNMGSILQFIEIMDHEIMQCIDQNCNQLVYRSENGTRDFTNAAFLLGAFMIVKLDQSPQAVSAAFKDVDRTMFEGYRDATYSAPDFRLDLVDCWDGLHRGKTLGWVALPTNSSASWGQIDKDAYAYYDDPLNADLHEVVPQKFVAFRGPRDLGGPTYFNNYEKHTRDFDPSYYVDIFEDLNVSSVIRLNEAQYSAQVFVDKGIDHHDLYFDDCTPPPPAAVKKFFQIVDQAPGVVAVHCKAGLGRTGTLIALYMMRTYGFSAREAMGWLRIMRPGCVIGRQQQFLCQVDAEMCKRSAIGRLPSNPIAAESWARRSSSAGRAANNSDGTSQQGVPPTDHAVLAEQVSAGVHRRNLARTRWACSRPSLSLHDACVSHAL